MKRANKATLWGLAVILIVLVSLHVRLSAVSARLDAAQSRVPSPVIHMDTHVTTYVDIHGTTQTITTVQTADESDAECLERHGERVAERKVEFPKA